MQVLVGTQDVGIPCHLVGKVMSLSPDTVARYIKWATGKTCIHPEVFLVKTREHEYRLSEDEDGKKFRVKWSAEFVFNLALVGAGMLVGLVSFSQVLSRLFKHFKNETLAVLIGFMLGSLAKLWPWKNTTSYQIKGDGSQIPLIQEPVFPAAYSSMTGQDAEIMVAVVCALVGGVLVLVLHWVARINNGPEN